MSEEQRYEIKKLVKIINTTVSDEDESLLDFVIEEVSDRVLIYLNDDTLDSQLNRVVARIASGIFNQSKNNLSSSDPDMAISSVSDNGQSVGYSNEVRNYLSTATDNELFTGFESLLSRYRRINVVGEKRK